MKKIKMLVMDVDGTLTDGKIYIGQKGEIMKAFSVKDGYSIARLKENGIEPVIITGRVSEIVEVRARELNITELHQGVEDKLDKLQDLIFTYGITYKEVAYIGDDLNDIECMKSCGITGCPQDAVEQIKKIADYVCKKNGGSGAVREFIDNIVNNAE